MLRVCDDLYDYTGWPVYNGSSLDTTHLVFSSYYNGSSSGAGVGVKNNAASVLPFGTIDTPAQGQTISGTDFINFGWVLTPQPNIIPIDGSTITGLHR